MVKEPAIDYTYCPPIPGNYVPGNRPLSQIKYLIFHYTASPGGSSLANTVYYSRTPSAGVGAHYFVDENKIFASTPVLCRAGSVGKWKASSYYSDANNDTSINIEMCCQSLLGKKASDLKGWPDNDIYFTQGTIDNAIALGRWLIDEFGFDKDHVIRHFDVFGKDGDPTNLAYRKACPRPFVSDDVNIYYNDTGNNLWNKFRDYLFSDNPAPLDLIKHDSPIDPSYKQWTAEVTHIAQDDYLNVRTGAGASYPNLSSYPRLALGNRVDVVSEALADDGRIWFQIRIAGKYYGYVRSDYLQPLTEIKIAKVDHVQRLIVRSEPKVSQQTVYKLYPALAKTNYVEILDSSDRFFDRIRFQDQKCGYHIAYASRYYLERV